MTSHIRRVALSGFVFAATLVWGAEDHALGKRAVEATAGLVKGPYELEILEGAGHWLQFERPAEVSLALTAGASK